MLFDYILLNSLENRHACKMLAKFCYIHFFQCHNWRFILKYFIIFRTSLATRNLYVKVILYQNKDFYTRATDVCPSLNRMTFEVTPPNGPILYHFLLNSAYKDCYIHFLKYYFKSGTIHAPPHHLRYYSYHPTMLQTSYVSFLLKSSHHIKAT